jgi:hypothetical protein
MSGTSPAPLKITSEEPQSVGQRQAHHPEMLALRRAAQRVIGLTGCSFSASLPVTAGRMPL